LPWQVIIIGIIVLVVLVVVFVIFKGSSTNFAKDLEKQEGEREGLKGEIEDIFGGSSDGTCRQKVGGCDPIGNLGSRRCPSGCIDNSGTFDTTCNFPSCSSERTRGSCSSPCEWIPNT
jgi:hypothetical protein